MKIIRFAAVILAAAAMFCTTSFAKGYDAEIVPGDTFEYTLEEEDIINATLTIDEDGLFGMSFSSITAEDDTYPKICVTVYDGREELLSFTTKRTSFSEEKPEKEKYSFVLGLCEGDYVITIENLTLFSEVSFVMETEFTEQEDTLVPSNSSLDAPFEIETGTKYLGGVSMEKDTDFLRFDMPYDGYAFIEMYSPKAKIFTLYDKDKNEIGNAGIEIEDKDKVFELRTGLGKGTYYISVKPEEDYTPSLYSVKVSTKQSDFFEKEYNNETKYAMPIKANTTYQGNLFGIEDEDVYTFTLDEKSNITVDFFDSVVSDDGHYSLWLTNGKDVLYYCDECGRESEKITLDKGTYYFTVGGLGEKRFTSMGYKFEISSDKKFVSDTAKEQEPVIPETKQDQEETTQFADVKAGKWYYAELLEAKKEGLIEGIGGNLYKPEENVTLAEIITMAVRIKNALGGVNTEITPSPVGKWYNSYITFAVNSGIIKMNDFDDFERNATRAEVAYIFANLFGDADAEKNIAISDVDGDTKYGREIHKLYGLGIIKGDGNGKFRPHDSITRAEAAAILLRVHKA